MLPVQPTTFQLAASAELDLRRRIAAALAVDQVLSVPQILSLSGMVFDHAGLERLPSVEHPPEGVVPFTTDDLGDEWVEALEQPHRAEPLHVPRRPQRRPPGHSIPVAPNPRDFPLNGPAQLFPLGGGDGAGRLYFFELVTAAVWNVASSMVSVDVVADWPMTLRYREHRVGHLLGCAQARIDLRVAADPNIWESDAAAVGEVERPDAYWRPSGHQVIAIEYDTGAYPKEVISRKVKAFDMYDGVVWACSSPRRRRRLRRSLGPLGYQVIAVDWWNPRSRVVAGHAVPLPARDVVDRGRWWTEV